MDSAVHKTPTRVMICYDKIYVSQDTKQGIKNLLFDSLFDESGPQEDAMAAGDGRETSG